MCKMINSEKMRELEANSEKLGVSKLQLMENAGHGLYQIIKEKYNLENKKILIIANHGNNGGDGFVLARYLKQNNYNVKVYFIGEQTRLKKESGYNYFFLKDLKGWSGRTLIGRCLEGLFQLTQF